MRMGLRKGDVWVLLFGAGLVLVAWRWAVGGPGERVEVRRGGEVVARLPLDRPARLVVSGPLGDSVIEVRDGRVRFLSAPCDRQLCVHSGWLSHGGDFAACLPNRVSLSVTAAENRYDSINF